MRAIIISIFVTLCAISVSAQVSLRPQMGFNTASFRDVDRSSYFENQVGWQFGADLQLGRTFYVQPGIFWESLENEIYQEIDDRRNTVTLNRIRIPLMLGYKLAGHHTNGWLNARVFTGPNISFDISKDLGEDPLFEKRDFRGSQWGWNLGFGLDLAFIFVDAGYQFGLSELIDGVSSSDNNNLFYGNVGIRIGF